MHGFNGRYTEGGERMEKMKYWYFQYIFMFLALTGMANSTKHLIRLGAWESLAFILFKDLVVTIYVVYFFHIGRATKEMDLRNLAVRAMMALLTISFVGDAAIMFLKG
ncbi:MAG: hypothetical protein ACLQKY_18735 [Terracidiphilus sp.]